VELVTGAVQTIRLKDKGLAAVALKGWNGKGTLPLPLPAADQTRWRLWREAEWRLIRHTQVSVHVRRRHVFGRVQTVIIVSMPWEV
jgi:hypothetical protein